MRKLCTLTLILAANARLMAQMPSISAPEQGAIHLKDLRIHVQVTGNIATTTWDMLVRNDQNRVLEGSLEFPLGDGQTVSRFAMDVNGTLREGVVVEKAKGREVFESIIRRGVDPGLLEKTEGNNFRARVYPIPAKGTKRVVIAYEQEIPGNQMYQLPLRFTDAVDRFELKVDVYQAGTEPLLKSATNGFSFQSQGMNWHGESICTNYVPNQSLTFKLPRGVDEETVFVQQDGGRRYFCVNANIQRPDEPKTLPGKVLVAWDASASAAKRDLKKELDVLEAYLKAIGKCTVHLVVFRDAAEPGKDFKIEGGHVEKLRKAIEALPLDGGTQLGCLALDKRKTDEVLLFSDGLNNFGQQDPRFPEGCSVITLNASTTANRAKLRHLAKGGDYLDLSTLKVQQALQCLKQQPLAFLGWSGAPGDIHEVYPSKGSLVRGSFTLTGMQIQERSQITLRFGYGGKVRFTRKLVIDGTRSMETGPSVSRLWAQKKLAELEADPETNQEAILALGRANNIVTEGTSLIVLENLQDYIHYRIPPPAEWRDEYERYVQAEDRNKHGEMQGRLVQVAQRFQEMKEWWKRSFAPDVPKETPKPVAISNPAASVSVLAQPTNIESRAEGSISGRVTDQAGNPISGCRVVLESASLFRPLTYVTNANGEYRALVLPIGTYVIKVSANGYLGKTATNVRVGIRGSLSLPFSLKTLKDVNFDPSSMTVEVVANMASESKTDDKVAVNYSAEQLRQLPAGTSFDSASQVAPGVIGSSASAQVRGSGSSQIMYRVDGINVIHDLGQALSQPLQNSLENVAARNGAPATPQSSASIQLKPWSSDAPYLDVLKKVEPEERYQAYLNLRKAYGAAPGFYLDVADLFEGWKQRDLALRIVSNLAELKLEEASLLRILGHRLEQMGEHRLSIGTFETVLRIRGEEPQSLRDLALAFEADGQHQRALDLLYQIVVGQWDSRFPEIEDVALVELNAIAAREKVDTSKVDPRLLSSMPVDVRVVLNWDTDNSDMDLWIKDPRGEVCKFDHNRTAMGGRISRDFTQGYGPEVFMLKKATAGQFQVQTNYYGTQQQTAIIGPTTLHVELYLHYGTPKQTRKDLILRLGERGSLVSVGDFLFDPSKP